MEYQPSSFCSPSKAVVWMNCPGSVAFNRQIQKGILSETPDLGETTCQIRSRSGLEYADKGSQVHKYLENMLRYGYPNDIFSEEVVECGDNVLEQFKQLQGVENFQELKGTPLFLEYGVEVMIKRGLPPLRGYVDVHSYSLDFSHLFVIDFKSGFQKVSAQKNYQLIMYAKALLKKNTQVIHLAIVGSDYYGYTTLTRQELLTEVAELKKAYTKVYSKNAILQTGFHCQKCMAAPICEKFNATVLETEDRAIQRYPLTVDKIADHLQKGKMVEKYLKDLRAYTYKLLESGVEVPGLKLVKGRSKRRWKNPQEAQTLLVLELGEGGAYEKELLSVAKAEGILKKLGKLDAMPDFIKEEGAPILSSEDSSREEVQIDTSCPF